MPVESCKVLGEWVSADPRLVGSAESEEIEQRKEPGQGLQESIFGK